MGDYTYNMYYKRYSHINEACEYDPNRTASAITTNATTPAATNTTVTPTAAKNFLQAQPTELFDTTAGVSFDQEKQAFDK